MKVVALVSGGKDSCFAMQQCIKYGHEIVALANLLPSDDSVDELDSYMYQTVGHQIVVAYAQCMGLPLFRRRIKGKARVLDLKYKETEGDEVEDLEILLRTVKAHFPTITGVSSGAIASDYQRLRVESVCSRLGLVSLAFLWKQDQALLLQQMIDSGIHAILVKVAALGLDPKKHLGKDLKELQPHLTDLSEKYGCNVCGEGGEYESLTLDCFLFKNARIVLEEFEVVLHSPDNIAPVGILHPKKYRLEQKGNKSMQLKDYASIESGSMTWVLEVGDNINRLYVEEEEVEEANGATDVASADGADNVEGVSYLSVIKQQHGFFTINCWRQPGNQPSGVADELAMVLKAIEEALKKEEMGWANVLFVHLYLDSMQHFSQANEVYMQHITEQECEKGVPSRCTVEVPLVANNMGLALVEVIASKNEWKQVLHVQSISCWAPSCIGPYSQGTHHSSFVYVAGQLGLDPPTMAIVTGDAGTEASQSLLNCEAVAGAFGVSLVESAASFTVYCSAVAGKSERRDIRTKLESYLAPSSGEEGVVDSHLSHSRRLVLYVVVPALPKGARVEVEPLVYLPPSSDPHTPTLYGYSSYLLYFTLVDGSVTSTTHDHNGVEAISSLSRSTIWNEQILPPDHHPPEDPSSRYFASAAVQSVCSPGSFCRAILSVRRKTDTEKVQTLQPVLHSCLASLSSTLQRAQLSWEDVLVLRIYSSTSQLSLDHLRTSLHTLPSWQTQNLSAVSQATLVPVSGIGMSASAQDMFAIELFASRQ